MREWRPLAEQGNASAQFNLGIMYNNGEGVLEDDREVVAWYRRAAEQRLLSDAQATRAAEQGNADAQNFLGDLYSWGLGRDRDPCP